MTKKKKPELSFDKKDLLSSGSTLLNLATTGTVGGCYGKGNYVFYVGDSMSGKTWFCHTMMAEACQLRAFKEYQLIHDDVERGAKMDIEYYFGKRLARRLTIPPLGISTTVEEFYFNVNEALDRGPCIYICDSMDSLSCAADIKQYEAERKAHAEGKETSGSYGTGKAKANSEGLRLLMGRLEETGSILVIISQTRDNIGFGSQFNPKTRSGGKSLRFYSHVEIWTSVVKTLKKKVRGIDRPQGAITQCRVEKNRINGQKNRIEVPFYHSYGIDDMDSCVEFLLNEKHWKKSKASIVAEDLEFKGTKGKLLQHIENNDLEPIVREIVGEVWNEIQDAMLVTGRKKRYE